MSNEEKIEVIKNLYKEIENKKDFVKAVSLEFKRKPKSIQFHWFSDGGFWSVPEKELDKLITFIQKYIQLKNGIIEL